MRRIENRKLKRRLLVGGFTGAAGLLTTTSVAFACTIFLGQMTVEGNARDPETRKTSAVTVLGSSRGMSYCNGYPNTSGRVVNPGAGETFLDSKLGVGPYDILKDEQAKNSVSVNLAPLDDDACEDHAGPRHWGGQLPDGKYYVNFFNGPGFIADGDNDTRRWAVDCMYSNEDYAFFASVERVGELEVAGGSASKKIHLAQNLLANGFGDESALCVTNQAGSFNDIRGESSNAGIGLFGMQAPIVVL